jgi:hypothetical protein
MVDPDMPEPGMFRLTLQNTPSPTDPEGADELYKALGIMIVAWGRLEGQFVLCLLMLLNLPGGTKLGHQLPMAFDNRSTMWRKAFDTMVALKPFKGIALALLDEIKEVAQDRHLIVHALWEGFDAANPPSISILNIKPKNKTKNGLETRRNSVTTAKLGEVAEKLNRLNRTLAPITQFLTWYRSSQNPPPADIRIV